jgi:hypothetical protein
MQALHVLVVECQPRVNWYKIFDGCRLRDGTPVEVDQGTWGEMSLTAYPDSPLLVELSPASKPHPGSPQVRFAYLCVLTTHVLAMHVLARHVLARHVLARNDFPFLSFDRRNHERLHQTLSSCAACKEVYTPWTAETSSTRSSTQAYLASIPCNHCYVAWSARGFSGSSVRSRSAWGPMSSLSFNKRTTLPSRAC